MSGCPHFDLTDPDTYQGGLPREVFGYLRETNYDGPLSVCVFGWEEEADAIHVRMRERIEAELG